MTKRTERAERTQGKNGAGPELAHLVEPMLAGMSSTRQHLLAWVHAQGLAALDELFREEAVALAGPKGRQQAQRTHHHWGTTATELTFGGRRGQMPRPRVRRTRGGGREVAPGAGVSGAGPPRPRRRAAPPRAGGGGRGRAGAPGTPRG